MVGLGGDWHRRSYGRLVTLSGTNPADLGHIEHEDLAIADFAGAGGGEDGLHGDVDERLGDPDLEPDLLLELHFDGGAR